MPDPSPPLQFDTAEYAGDTTPCANCGAPLSTWYTIGATPVCPRCKGLLEARFAPATWPQVGTGTLFGAGAALGGALAWWGVRSATGIDFGILAIGIAWGVAWAMIRGAGVGGRAQQLITVGLVYVAIALAEVPDLYTGMLDDAGADGIGLVVRGITLVVATALALAMPILVVLSDPAGSILWLIIRGIALWSGWSRTAGLQLSFAGPYGGGASG